MSYAQEKLYQAMQCLTSEGPLRDRLAFAAIYIDRLLPEDLADTPYLSAWQQIREDLTWVEAGPGDLGNIDATIKRMIDEDVGKVAEAILSLYHNLARGWRD